MIALVLGGARSGKSALAERMAVARAEPVTYVATAAVDVGDADLTARIDAHRTRRPAAWSTVEAGTDLPARLRGIAGLVLLDSLGTWVAGHHDFVLDADALVAALVERAGDTIVVAEEVGLGVHPETPVGRRFRDALGTVNQAVAAVADDTWFVAAGQAVRLERPPW